VRGFKGNSGIVKKTAEKDHKKREESSRWTGENYSFKRKVPGICINSLHRNGGSPKWGERHLTPQGGGGPGLGKGGGRGKENYYLLWGGVYKG